MQTKTMSSTTEKKDQYVHFMRVYEIFSSVQRRKLDETENL